MEDAQASFQILCPPTASRLLHLFRTVPLSIKHEAVAITTLWWNGCWSCRGRATIPGGTSPRSHRAEIRPTCDTRPYGRATYQSKKASLEPPSGISIKGAACIGCHALTLELIDAASVWGDLPFLLERLPERPMTSALFNELKTRALEVKKSK